MIHKVSILLATLTLALGGPLSAAPTVECVAGVGTAGSSGDGGPATKAQLNNPFGVIRGPDGLIYFCEYDGQVVRRIEKDRTLTTIAGTGKSGYTGDGGPATQATLGKPHEIRFDKAGDLFIADMQNHAVRKVNMKTRTITTIAGNGKAGYTGDGGPATAATMKLPHSIQFSPGGDLFICDVGNHVVRKVETKTGTITTYAGTGKPGPTPDGSPVSGTPLNGPRSLDFDSADNLWLATREGNQVFKIDTTSGTIFHIAGTGKKGFTGNGGPAKLATLSGPKGVAIGADGIVYIADTESQSIRKIDPKTGTLDIAVGTGAKPAPGENGFNTDPLQIKLNRPHGIYVDADNSLYVGDSENHVLLHVTR